MSGVRTIKIKILLYVTTKYHTARLYIHTYLHSDYSTLQGSTRRHRRHYSTTARFLFVSLCTRLFFSVTIIFFLYVFSTDDRLNKVTRKSPTVAKLICTYAMLYMSAAHCLIQMFNTSLDPPAYLLLYIIQRPRRRPFCFVTTDIIIMQPETDRGSVVSSDCSHVDISGLSEKKRHEIVERNNIK